MGKTATTVSPLAPKQGFPAIPPIAGLRLSAGAAGVRYQGRDDVILAELAPGTTVAGVLTRSKTASAPVAWCRSGLASRGGARGLVVNAGNANAFTGKIGERSVKRTADAAAKMLGAKPKQIYIASTGVIGEPLPEDRIIAALPSIKASLTPDGFSSAAHAIMTTDTFVKGAVRRAKIGDADITIAGFCKGAGMIQPNMGTMLAFLFTDARLPAPVLQSLLGPIADRTFNSITVDSDTSTSDTCLLFATGAVGRAQPRIERAGDAKLRGFKEALEAVMRELAHLVVRDGEGATKFVAIKLTGATSRGAAKRLAFAVANSPLVKTAIAGQDPNWGRIVAALGKAGERLDQAKLDIRIGGLLVAEKGARAAVYDEAATARHMKGEEIVIEIDLGLGRGAATVWTCDLTHAYIDINADYRS
ncbi:MAG: bifunctional glutamate N-acetyltransferase/amino-acid acetyltransferase ArgJ [Alphaproteobacteria bacterium]|nr:bifunctional glutamate N-acetyltransferase/amino-acid acetyltransferase ArgJ [Alphaproteobacteria bacterium]